MNREDLCWALDAVLPHVGRTAETAVVGLTRDSEFNLVAYATDRYTFGAAHVPNGPDIDVRLSTKEARDLRKFVSPQYVREHQHEVITLVHENELHVGLVDEEGETYDSAVFETAESDVSLKYLHEFIAWLTEHPDEYQACIYQPKIFGRFSKAGRDETDRLFLLPKRLDEKHGAALVKVGQQFVGAIAGMSYDQPTTEREVA